MAIAGPVVIGENNVIEERVLIKNWYGHACADVLMHCFVSTPNSVLSIGNNNKFEVGSSERIEQFFVCWPAHLFLLSLGCLLSVVTAPFIGNCNVVEVKGWVHHFFVLFEQNQTHCSALAASVGPACTLANGCIVGSRCSIGLVLTPKFLFQCRYRCR